MTVTLITGAGRGIGFETARALTERGHTVYLGVRDAERGARAAAELGVRSVELDVTDDASVAAALARIEAEHGHLDLLVNNAGVMTTELSGPAALQSFDVNAVGIVRVTEAALPLLRKAQDPAVVTISSSMGSFWAVTNPDRPESAFPLALYAASKAAATMLTLQYAKANPDVRFNALEPDATATDMTAAFGIGRPVTDSAALVARFVETDRSTGTLQDENGVLAW
jgi:NAD(P)-dependent dehydrogenase (short-subunit alcohol dehydrogenase family)